MSFLSRVLGRREPRVITDTALGPLRRSKGGWEGNQFSLWDQSEVQLLIDAGDEGPSQEQRHFIEGLRDNNNPIRGRIEEAVTSHVKETPAVKPAVLRLSSIYIPKLESPYTWRVWYDLEGEGNLSYGAEITHTEEIIPFADD